MSALEGAIIGHYIGKYIVNAIHRIFPDCVPCLQINIHHFEVCILWYLMAYT
jgi:hypothetical protein